MREREDALPPALFPPIYSLIQWQHAHPSIYTQRRGVPPPGPAPCDNDLARWTHASYSYNRIGQVVESSRVESSRWMQRAKPSVVFSRLLFTYSYLHPHPHTSIPTPTPVSTYLPPSLSTQVWRALARCDNLCGRLLGQAVSAEGIGVREWLCCLVTFGPGQEVRREEGKEGGREGGRGRGSQRKKRTPIHSRRAGGKKEKQAGASIPSSHVSFTSRPFFVNT